MANHRKDVTGQAFGKMIAIKPAFADVNGRWWWWFQCECGNKIERNLGTMVKAQKMGAVSHCGCSPALKTHGLSKKFQKLNWVWTAMKQRCYNPTCKDFANYGGRGITVCEEWHDFKTFHEWALLTGYKEKVTIERVDVNGDYCPPNCTWVINEVQPLNRTNTVRFLYNGEMRRIREISELSGISFYALKNRLVYMGWDIERATTEPVFRGKNQTYKRNENA